MKDDFKDVLEIFNSLSDLEKFYILDDEESDIDYIDSPYVQYRKIEYVEKEPASYLELYVLHEFPSMAFVVVATKEKYRNLGLSKKLLKEAEEKNKETLHTFL